MTNAPNLMARFLFSGSIGFFDGHTCASDEDHSEYLLYANFDGESSLRDIVDQLVDDDETLPEDITDSDVRAALLDMLTVDGRADYESGELAVCAVDFDAESDSGNSDESPVYIVLLDCVNPSRRTKGPVLVGRKDSEYWFIDSVFWHCSDLRGCTAMTVCPISEAWSEKLLSTDMLKDRFGDSWAEKFKDSIDDGCKNCRLGLDEDGCEHCRYPSLQSFCNEIAQYDGIDAVIDNPGDDYCDKIVAVGADAEYADCVGCGRMFNADYPVEFDEVYNRKALVACLAYEDGAVSYDYAVKAIYG